MEVVIIAAMAENRVIGRDNALPWPNLKPDMARFRKLTLGWPCIMGRKTWESLPKRPFPGRPNLVVSASLPADAAPGATVLRSLREAVRHCEGQGYERAFVCGGASIYREAFDFADRMELTLIRRQFEGDVFFPEVDLALWRETSVEDFDGFSFVSYSRVYATKEKQ